MLPGRRGLADLLGQLALAALQRALALLVELARRQLEQVRIAGRLARLAHQPDMLGVVGDDRRPIPGGTTHWRVDLLAVLVAERALADVDDRPLEHGARLQALETRAHGAGMLARGSHRGGLVEQREADVEHPLQRDDAHALGRLVVVLGAVGQVDALDSLSPSALASEPPPVTILLGS